MTKRFITDLNENEQIETTFLVLKKNVLSSKNGNPYINLTLADRTGRIEGRIWDKVDELASRFERSDFVVIKARVIRYQDKLQLNVGTVHRVDDADIHVADFLPASANDPDKMIAALKKILFTMDNTHLRRLIQLYFEDRTFLEKFRKAPAAKDIHHSYLGGLLEHTLSLANLANLMAAHYPFVDRDLLLTGVFLHDLGKIDELSYNRAFDYTDEGRLLGHISIGVLALEKKISALPDFPRELRVALIHLVLSHHGEFEFASPRRPKTIEGLLLHLIDNLDSKMHTMLSAIEREKDLRSDWTTYHRIFERYIYKKNTLDRLNTITKKMDRTDDNASVETFNLF